MGSCTSLEYLMSAHPDNWSLQRFHNIFTSVSHARDEGDNDLAVRCIKSLGLTVQLDLEVFLTLASGTVGDFRNWYRWYQTYCSRYLPLDGITAQRVYHLHYSCKCETCEFRMAHGLMPLKGVGSSQCTLENKQLDLVDLWVFPVKQDWWERASLMLIVNSARELHRAWARHPEVEVRLPRPGCGAGGLKWADVKPVIERILPELNFMVCSK